MNVHVAEQPAPAGRARRGRKGALDGIDTARLHDYSMAELGAHCTAFNCRKMTNAGKVIYGRLLNHIEETGRHEELDLSFGDFLDQIHQREPDDPKRGQPRSRDYEYMQIAEIDLVDLPERPIPVRCLIAVQENGPTGTGAAEVVVRRGLFELAQSYKEDEAPWLASVAEEARELLERQLQGADDAGGVEASVAQVKPVLAMLEGVAGELSTRREAAARQRKLDQAEHVVDTMDDLTQGMRAAEVVERAKRMVLQLQRVMERAQVQAAQGAPRGPDAAQDRVALVAARSGCPADAAANPAPDAEFVDAEEAPDPGRPGDAAPPAPPADAATDDRDDAEEDGQDADDGADEDAQDAADEADGQAAAADAQAAAADAQAAAEPTEPTELWYAPVARALVAGMDEDRQRDLSRQLRLVVQDRPVETFESYLRGQWEGCGMEAAGVDREIFDDVMELICGPEWISRAWLALGLLYVGRPNEWGLNIHMLAQVKLPEDLRSEVLRISRTVRKMEPRIEVVDEDEREEVQRVLDAGGPEAAQMLDHLEELAFMKVLLERVDWKNLDDRVQRRLHHYSAQRVLELSKYHGIPRMPPNLFDDDPDPVYDTYDPLMYH